jgi:sulfatase maturation enzyme AslB (radical SAM superfamily)
VSKEKTFCIIPWIHTHTWPGGQVFPCCLSRSENVIGNLNTSSFEAIWNGETYRQLRLDLLNGVERDDICGRCYEIERTGASESMRQASNRAYAKYIPIVDASKVDGSAKQKLIRWDYRFNNICNLSCRTCGPDLSSSWHDDHARLYPGADETKFKIHRPSEMQYKTLIDDHIDVVEEIYFAGGEPLLMPEHAHTLNRLIERGRTNLRIGYNTNLSVLGYKGLDFPEIWKKFEKVTIGVSLDEIGERAEYWRNGTKWLKMVENLKRIVELSKEHPSINIVYSPTISIFNAHRLADQYDYLFGQEKLWSPTTYLSFNVLTGPDYYDMRVATPALKEIGVENLDRLWKSVWPIDPYKKLEPQIENLKKTYLETLDDQEYLHNEFVKMTAKMDKLRGQSMKIVAPEIWDAMFEGSRYQEYYDKFNG